MNTQVFAALVTLVFGHVANAQSVPAVLLAGAGFFDGGVRRDFAVTPRQFDSHFRGSSDASSSSNVASSSSNDFSSSSNDFSSASSSSVHESSAFQEQGQESQVQSSSSEYPLDGVFEPLGLSSGASLILGNIDTSFSCGDYPYGFYADEYNFCRVFHVCVPFLYDDGHIEPTQYSFMCSGESVFDQSQLTCVERYDAAVPCEESSFHYSSNEAFGLPHEKA